MAITKIQANAFPATIDLSGVDLTIGTGEIATTNLADSAVSSAKLASAVITPDKLADSAVHTSKLASSSITTPKIADNAIHTAKIADTAVTHAKLHTDMDLTSKTVVLPDMAAFNFTSGNVGIGTDSANTPLEVVGTVTATSYIGDGSSLTGINTDLVDDTTPQLGGNLDLNSSNITGTGNVNITGTVTATSFSGDGSSLTGIESLPDAISVDGSASANTINIDASSNVGIGTTSPDEWSVGSSYKVLSVGGNGSAGIVNLVDNGTAGSYLQFGNSTIRRASIHAVDGSDVVFTLNSTNSGTALTERVRFTNDGNVGIATNNPTTKLNINVGTGGSNGTAGLKIGGTSNYDSLELGIYGAYGGMIRSYGNDLHYFSGHWKTIGTSATENHSHYWYTSKNGSSDWSTVKMELDHDGNLGIGTTSPAEKLDVNGKILIHNGQTYATYLGRHPVHTAYGGLYNQDFQGSNTSGFMIISGGSNDGNTYINGDSVYIRGGNNSSTNELRVTTSGSTIGGNTVWHAGNDGSGSGLDADTVDGLQASQFLRSDAGDSLVPSGWTAPNTLAALNIGYNGSGQTRAIDIDGSWGANESKAISFTHASTATNLVGQWDVQHNSPGSRMRWGKLYHNGDSSAFTMELISENTSTAYLTVNGSMRSPIFYDSNDTGYYVNPNGTSSMWNVNIRGDANSTATSNQIFFWSNGSTTTSAIGFKSNGGNFTNPTGNGDGYNTYLTMDTAGRGWVFRRGTGGTDFTAAYTSGWILNNGVWQANASMRSPIFYDSNNTNYYIHADGESSINSLKTAGTLLIGGSFSNNHYNSVSTTRLTFGGGNDINNYFIGTNMENYGGNYTKLDLRWHTGIRMGAQQGYGGVRIYDSEDLGTVRFSIAKGDANTRVESGSFYSNIMYDRDNTSYYLDPSSTGDSIRVAGDIVAYYSDARLKDFHGRINNALDKVLKINGYYYTENETAKALGYNTGRTQVGVSAQEVEEVLPEVIKDAPIGHGYKTVQYERMIPLLLEAIKELKEENNELKARLDAAGI